MTNIVGIDAELARIKAARKTREAGNADWVGPGDEVREPPPPLRALTLPELLAMDIRPRSMVLDPIMPEKGLGMLYGPRGMGKTLLALSIAYGVASGTKVLRWSAPEQRRVLYADGEMPLAVLRERLAHIVSGAEGEPPPDYLQILAADHLDDGLPSLASPAGQALIEPLLAGVSLLVIDNISTLASCGRDNDAESWTPVQEWLLRLRRRGLSVLLVHHAGKGGQQRGDQPPRGCARYGGRVTAPGRLPAA